VLAVKSNPRRILRPPLSSVEIFCAASPLQDLTTTLSFHVCHPQRVCLSVYQSIFEDLRPFVVGPDRPSFHRSIVPSFHRSIVPSFHRSLVVRSILNQSTTLPYSYEYPTHTNTYTSNKIPSSFLSTTVYSSAIRVHCLLRIATRCSTPAVRRFVVIVTSSSSLRRRRRRFVASSSSLRRRRSCRFQPANAPTRQRPSTATSPHPDIRKYLHPGIQRFTMP